MTREINPKYKHKDTVWYLNSDGKISKEQIIGFVDFKGSYDTVEDKLYISYLYSLSGWIAGTKFNQNKLFETREEAEKALIARSRR